MKEKETLRICPAWTYPDPHDMPCKRETYSGSSSDGRDDGISSFTSREAGRRTVRMIIGIFREVMPLLLMREGCLLLLVFDYDGTISDAKNFV